VEVNQTPHVIKFHARVRIFNKLAKPPT